eukprot:14231700-Heterocapsa_arctica.AAC.1
MEAVEVCHPCTGNVTNVYIDGSATKAGASCYAGWGFWTLDDHLFNQCVPLLGKEQGSDMAEVRALAAVLAKSEDVIEVTTDNQYVRDTAQHLLLEGWSTK